MRYSFISPNWFVWYRTCWTPPVWVHPRIGPFNAVSLLVKQLIKQLVISPYSSTLIEGHVWKHLLLMATSSELCRVKTGICIEKELRYGQAWVLNPCEQILKNQGDVVKVVVRTRNRRGHGKRYALPACVIDGIGGRSFLASLVSTTPPPTAKRDGVTAVQFHARHVQEIPIAVQSDAPHLLPFTISRPLAKMPIHSFIMQQSPCEERWDGDYMPLTACLQPVEIELNDLRQVTFWDKPAFCYRQMRKNFRFYRIFVQYFVQERSVYLGLASQA